MNFKFFSKYKLELLSLFFLLVFFFLTRLINLSMIPLFTDEAIYMRWSQVGQRDAAWRFIPLTDGKPPLYHWFVMIVMALDIFHDPIMEGRIVSVGAGFMSLMLILGLSHILFENKRITFFSGLIYVLSPFMLVYDRLAIVDSLLTSTSLASLFFAVLLVKYRRLDTALLFGASVGAGMLTKSSGLLFLLLSPATVLVGKWSKKKFLKQFLIWLGLFIIAAILAQVIYNLLRLSQFYYRIEQKNYEFIIPFSEFLKNPFEMTWGNLKSLFKWQIGYLSIPWSLLIVYALTFKERWRQHLLLLAYTIPPFIAIASFNKIIFPRFLVFSTPFLLILGASGLDYLLTKIKSKNLAGIAVILILLLPAKASFDWIFNPIAASIPQADKDQYLNGQPSGIGVKEIVSIIQKESESGPVFLGTDGTFGLTPDAFLVYFIDNQNVLIEGYYPVTTVPEEVINKSETMPTYFVYYNVQEIIPQENIELVGEYPKVSPSSTTYLRLFKVKS